jgi:hypothetical protein
MLFKYYLFAYLFYKSLIKNTMGKGKDAKKAVKKEPTMTPKEKKAAKRAKKAKRS